MTGDWLLDPDVTYLTHGTFGSCPRPILELQTRLREQLERQPLHFLDDELEERLDTARAGLARFLGAQPLDVAFVPNATTGVNTVLRSIELRPGDEILGHRPRVQRLPQRRPSSRRGGGRARGHGPRSVSTDIAR